MDIVRDKFVYEFIIFVYIKGNLKFVFILEMYIDNVCGYILCMLGILKDIFLVCLDFCVEVWILRFIYWFIVERFRNYIFVVVGISFIFIWVSVEDVILILGLYLKDFLIVLVVIRVCIV